MTARIADLSRQLDEIVERGELVVPPYPAAAMRLRSLIESDKFGLSQIADAASADAALATALLRIANSPVYRGDGPPYTTLLRAVNRLGARAVSSLALAAGVGTAATSPGPLADVKYRVWRRSITCALAAQRFGPARGIDGELAFLTGLLHGFGRSVAVACIEKLLGKSTEAHTLTEWLELVEQHRAKLAERVARLWQLPAAIAATMSIDGSTGSPGAELVAFADRIAGGLERGANGADLARELGLEPTLSGQVERFIAHLPGALEAFIQPMDVPKKARVSNAVAKPDSMLPGDLHALDTPVLDLRKGTPEPLESIGIVPLGLLLKSNKPLQESSVIRLAIQTKPTPIEAWFNVVLCVPEAQRFRLELIAFAASSDLRERMAQLWAGAAPIGRTSLGPTV